MLRGVITFTSSQIDEILPYLEKRLKDSMLYVKLKAGRELNSQTIQVELSEDEIEIILDEIGIEGSKELRNLINANLLKWRS